MTRNGFTATILATVIALTTATAAPAIASPDRDDVARILLGLAAAGIIAKALENERDREREEARRAREREEARREQDRRHRRALPARCEFEVHTSRGWRNVFGKRCLRNEGVRVNRLPERCEFRARTHRGDRNVFGARCLAREGYRVEARRH